MDSKNNKVLMFPWLAHGHVTPFLELAKKLSKRNFYIYFCSTTVNLQPIKAKINEFNFPSIQLVEIHLPSLPDLPCHYHTTEGLPLHLKDTLVQAFDMASPTFLNILNTLSPDLLICDMLQSWAPVHALSLNIPTVVLLVGGTIFLVDSLKNSGAVFPLKSNFVCDYGNRFFTLDDRIFQSFERSSSIMLARSVGEVEGKYIDELSSLTNKKILLVGPLVQEASEEDERAEIMEWLNKKEPSSVVFVSFGSEHYLSKEDREELAHGLLLSNVNFMWVLRFPKGEKMSVKEALPEGFIEMTGEKGMIVEDWAPQKRILGHPSVGGFVSHCGWGSIMESMKFGVPIIAMPYWFDQPLQARMLEEMGLGLEVKRGQTQIFEREEVAKVIKDVLMEKEGETIRRKAREMEECTKGKGEMEIDEVADELVQLCGMKTMALEMNWSGAVA